ncbi:MULTISPECIES: hypothetical protein [Actinoalloteichus]|uniref:Uncharacterized protein n=1 Tax=Actinoalloteichus fjordicus TaxID=1612552 RepID=A0AAC9LCQ9_9PSEU|nr:MULTISPECIES: hypothetical protein [Actinoalloteichus]APU15192.1 hypothetical protein UA74_15700 [Actinoalloteichus fjordicus]APU21261.1 hypothetical protein UA75_16265 [Actinoalloteichus sp. GBA129-24]
MTSQMSKNGPVDWKPVLVLRRVHQLVGGLRWARVDGAGLLRVRGISLRELEVLSLLDRSHQTRLWSVAEHLGRSPWSVVLVVLRLWTASHVSLGLVSEPRDERALLARVTARLTGRGADLLDRTAETYLFTLSGMCHFDVHGTDTPRVTLEGTTSDAGLTPIPPLTSPAAQG